MKQDLKHVRELDGVRGCAALAVLVLHLFITVRSVAWSMPKPLAWRFATHVADIGSYGVDVFFVLSGFLITSLLLKDREKKHYFNNFYWKRVLRIQPVYLVHLVATWMLIPQSHGYVILGLLFLVNFDTYFHVADMGPAWTLSIEEQFYLLWPQLIRRVSVPHIYKSCLIVIGVSAGLRTFALTVLGHAALRSTYYRFDGLAMGALLACEWMTEGEGASMGVRRLLRLFHSRTALWLALLYEAACFSTYLPDRWCALLLFTTNFLAYRGVRHILYQQSSWGVRWLRSPPLLFFGAISYALYMYHTLLIVLYDRYFGFTQFTYGRFFLRAGCVTVATVLLCVASLYGMERPVQRLRRYVVK